MKALGGPAMLAAPACRCAATFVVLVLEVRAGLYGALAGEKIKRPGGVQSSGG